MFAEIFVRTDRQTDRELIEIVRSPTGSEVIKMMMMTMMMTRTMTTIVTQCPVLC